MEERPWLKGLRILVVEDAMANQKLLCRLLKTLGHDAVGAVDGVVALEVFDSDPSFDIVITDLTMPRMGGIELTAALRGREFILPIIALTGNVLSEGERERERRMAFELWVSGVLTLLLLLQNESHSRVRAVT